MALIPMDILPCVKIPGTTIQIPIALLESHQEIYKINRSLNSVSEISGWLKNLDLNMSSVNSLLNSNESANLTTNTPPPAFDSIISNPFYLTISIGSAVGNLIMLSVILCKQRFRKPVNLLVANLSLSSFLFIVSSNLRLMENAMDLWTYTTFICQVLAVLHRIPIPVIALTTMTISLDRGRVARNPIAGSNNLSPVWKIINIWGFSLLILIPLGFTRKYDHCTSTFYKCSKIVMLESATLSTVYGIIYLLSVHIIPAIILVQETVKTLNKIKFLKISGAREQTESFPDNRLRLRILRNSCILCIIFLVFWLPYGIFQFPLDLPREILPEILETYIHIYFKFFRNVTYALIALNPVILFILSYDVSKHFCRLLLHF